jgi:hypothetical protein
MMITEEVDRREAEAARDRGEQPVHRVHQHVLPDQGAHGRHDEERGDRQEARHAAAVELLVEQHGEQRAQPHRDHQHPEDEVEGVEHRRPQGRVGQEVGVVLEAGEARRQRVEQVVVLEREPERHRQRHDHP